MYNIDPSHLRHPSNAIFAGCVRVQDSSTCFDRYKIDVDQSRTVRIAQQTSYLEKRLVVAALAPAPNGERSMGRRHPDFSHFNATIRSGMYLLLLRMHANRENRSIRSRFHSSQCLVFARGNQSRLVGFARVRTGARIRSFSM